MRTCIVQSHRLNCVVSKSDGKFALQDMQLKFQSIFQLELYAAGAPVLCDMRDVNFIDTSPADMLQVGRAEIEEPPENQTRKVAIIASSDLAFGQLSIMARLQQTADHLPMVVRSLQEALDWLDVSTSTRQVPGELLDLLANTLRTADGQDTSASVILAKETSIKKAQEPEMHPGR